jgi:hypothetical protein
VSYLENVLSHVLIRSSRHVVAALAFLIVPALAFAQQPLQPPQRVKAADTPSDAGGAITLVWSASSYDGPGVRYQIRMANGENTPTIGAAGKVIAEFPSDTHYVRDAKLPWWTRPADPHDHYYALRSGKGVELTNGATYVFTVSTVKGEQRVDAPTVQAVPEPNWVNWNSMNNFLVVLLFGG